MLEHLTITPLSHSGTETRFVISNGDSFFEANEITTDLIQSLKDAADIDRGIDNFIANHGNSYNHDDLKEFITTRLIDKLNNPAKRNQFLYQKELISSETLSQFSSIARVLFKPWIMAMITAIAIAAETVFFVTTNELLRFGFGMDIFVLASVIIFVITSSAIHELGHATACRYLGIGHGGVGFGLHLNFPVFYTDVSQAWTLSRRKRCLINIAGIYFQLILIIFLVAIYYFTRLDLVRYMIVAVNMSFFLTLNPFFKFDGYWLASDLMGITNLRAKTRDVVSYMFGRLRRKTGMKKPEILCLPRHVRYIAMAYTVCVNLFFCYFFLYIIPTFLINLIQQLPGQTREIIYFASNRMVPPFTLLMNLASELLFVALVGFMVYGMTKPLWKRIKLKKVAS